MKGGFVGLVLSWTITFIAAWFAYRQSIARGELLLRLETQERDFAAYELVSTPIDGRAGVHLSLAVHPEGDSAP